MKLVKIIVAVFFSVAMVSNSHAQKKKTIAEPIATINAFRELAIIGKTKNGAIWLRWSPYSQSAWDKGIEFGYTLERANVKSNQKVELFKNKKPEPEAFWREKVASGDQRYFTNAYSIYGYLDDKNRVITDLIQAMDEANQRHLFALLGADLSFDVAQAATLGYKDSTAIMGETYVYTLSINVTRENVGTVQPENTKPITMGQVIEMPSPMMTAKSGNQVAILEWDTEKIREFYNTYTLEESENDKENFNKLNEGAILNATEEEQFKVMHIDSLEDFKTTHYYRVKGTDVFEDEGPYSEIVSAKSIPPISMPEITNFNLIDSTTLSIEWAFGDSLEPYIQGFKIQQSDSLYSHYQDATVLLPPTTRSRIIVPFKLPINVRVIVVVDSNYSVLSFPISVFASDSIPPEPPSGLFAQVDSSGIVSIVWDKNPEKDLKGYYVARRDISSEYYFRISNNLIIGEFFLDTLDMKLLNRDYYYKAMAVDNRMNVSELSEEYHVQKPDIYGPTRPVFTSYKVEDKKISLSWERSYSNDVESHTLYRKSIPSDDWQAILVVKDTLTKSYIDTTVLEKHLYTYTIIARDSSQNESEPANPYLLETPFFTKNITFQEFKADFNEEKDLIFLNWKCNKIEEIESFQLYKAVANEEFSILKSVATAISKWTDYPNPADTIYKYLIRAKMKDGYLSGWEEVTIDIKR
jgi:hypothetical protein